MVKCHHAIVHTMDTIRYIKYYFFYLALLFGLLYTDLLPISSQINTLQTTLTLSLLEPFLPEGALKGIDIWITPHYKIYISQACNGFIPIFILWAAILAYPASLKHRLVWTLISYVSFTLINILRILFVVYVAYYAGGEESFILAHDILGNTMLILTGLLLLRQMVRTI